MWSGQGLVLWSRVEQIYRRELEKGLKLELAPDLLLELWAEQEQEEKLV